MARDNTRILDSVHGYICIPKEYSEKIVDTPEFQRLRRIEQTSGRSIYPSARHDRFIHSLGVYHIGCKIVNEIIRKRNEMSLPEDNILFPILISYELACLLHDVGHSPFSHTFEEYFQKPKLKEALIQKIDDASFKSDFNKILSKNYAEHEIMSALMAFERFGQFIELEHTHRLAPNGTRYRGNAQLVVRMIVGCKYQGDKEYCIENAFIDLIHGTIDADGIDYVCRDVWASGYATSNVDIERLISSIIIHRENGRNHLCFTCKALYELRAVLMVKTFQQDNVIKHHTVVYEQALLKKAMESAALYHAGKGDVIDEHRRKRTLQKLCEYKSMTEKQHTIKFKIPILHPMDDDFIALMKYQQEENPYIKEWFSRKYQRIPLWKHYEDFYATLIDAGFMENQHNLFNEDEKQKLLKRIADNFNIPREDVWLENGTASYKLEKLSDINLLVNNKIYHYDQLYKEEMKQVRTKLSSFYYIYVPNNADIDAIRQFVIDCFMQGL